MTRTSAQIEMWYMYGSQVHQQSSCPFLNIKNIETLKVLQSSESYLKCEALEFLFGSASSALDSVVCRRMEMAHVVPNV